MRHFPGNYTEDWKEVQARAVEAVGHRCIRCHHPYRKGMHGNGEWSPCDDQCFHGPPIRIVGSSDAAGRFLPNHTEAQWRILTTHHFDGHKSNNAWWNLLVLCQRCHLQIQGKVDPNTPYFLEHSTWIKPYVAGFYASKYLKEDLTREQVMARLEELLKLEQLV